MCVRLDSKPVAQQEADNDGEEPGEEPEEPHYTPASTGAGADLTSLNATFDSAAHDLRAPLHRLHTRMDALTGLVERSGAKLIAVGESKADPALDPATLAAWTMTANEVMNLDEVLNK